MNRVSSGVTRSKLDTKQRRTAYISRRVSSSTILCRASLYMFTNTCIYIYILPTVSSTSIFHQQNVFKSRAVLRVEIGTAVEFGERGY